MCLGMKFGSCLRAFGTILGSGEGPRSLQGGLVLGNCESFFGDSRESAATRRFVIGKSQQNVPDVCFPFRKNLLRPKLRLPRLVVFLNEKNGFSFFRKRRVAGVATRVRLPRRLFAHPPRFPASFVALILPIGLGGFFFGPAWKRIGYLKRPTICKTHQNTSLSQPGLHANEQEARAEQRSKTSGVSEASRASGAGEASGASGASAAGGASAASAASRGS